MPSASAGPFIPFERVIIFIDGNYLRKRFKEFFGDDNIDFFKVRKQLLSWYTNTPANPFRPNLIRTYYYDGKATKEPKRSEHEKYFDLLKRRFFFLTVRLGEAVKVSDEEFKRTRVEFRQKGVDILMAIDALTMAFRDYYDAGLFVLGDRDFIPLIKAMKDAGKKTYGFSYIEKVPSELVWEFDFRLAFNKRIMEKWRYTKEY